MLGLGKVAAKEVYAALDWLGREQPFIEATLARRHLKDGALPLYDVTSTYLEGRCCELAQHGYSREHRGDRPQLVIGLMCAADGCPVAGRAAGASRRYYPLARCVLRLGAGDRAKALGEIGARRGLALHRQAEDSVGVLQCTIKPDCAADRFSDEMKAGCICRVRYCQHVVPQPMH
jgi:hypothetical protein